MYYNIASILLGLAALAVPLLALRRGGGHFASFGLCMAALLCQFFELARRAALGDLSAIADTVRAVCIAAAALCLLCMAVNLFCRFMQKR